MVSSTKRLLTCPQALQWCLLRVTVNWTLHSWHILTALSGSHGGAKFPSGILSSSTPSCMGETHLTAQYCTHYRSMHANVHPLYYTEPPLYCMGHTHNVELHEIYVCVCECTPYVYYTELYEITHIYATVGCSGHIIEDAGHVISHDSHVTDSRDDRAAL